MFQASNTKGKQFLDLLDNYFHLIELSYTKRDSWIKYFKYSNSLCTRFTRAIVNYTSIREYYFCFFSNKDFNCPYGIYLIESRCHILHDYRKFNKYWNLR